MPDGRLVVYYCDVLKTTDFRRAVLRQIEDGIYRILEVTSAESNFAEVEYRTL